MRARPVVEGGRGTPLHLGSLSLRRKFGLVLSQSLISKKEDYSGGAGPRVGLAGDMGDPVHFTLAPRSLDAIV